MKKIFLVILAAGLFVACGNTDKKADENDKQKQENVEATTDEGGKQNPDSDLNDDGMGVNNDVSTDTTNEVSD